LQLAAYRHAEFAAVWRARRFEQYSRRYYLLNPEERAMALPMPKTDGGLVIHITPEHCDVYPSSATTRSSRRSCIRSKRPAGPTPPPNA
jgi:hypothetical protein